jgi:hypothetical protein
VPELVLRRGKVVREEQFSQAYWKLVPELVLRRGKVVREEQLNQVSWKLVPELVLRRGKVVREEQLYQALPKLVPELVLRRGKYLKLAHCSHVEKNCSPFPVSIVGNEYRSGIVTIEFDVNVIVMSSVPSSPPTSLPEITIMSPGA